MFVVQCLDKIFGEEIRLQNRPAHLEFLKANQEKVVLAGPLLDEERKRMVGSLLVLNIENRDDLADFLAQDPYAKAGLFVAQSVTPFKKVLP